MRRVCGEYKASLVLVTFQPLFYPHVTQNNKAAKKHFMLSNI